jgi:hypothetical protein
LVSLLPLTLIYAVRDAVSQREAIREKKMVVSYQDVSTDPGVIDKRLLVYESEFAGVLKVAQREGNLLSVILRQARDSGNLRNTVKSSPLRATDAHISVIGHITIDELQRYLTDTEMGNGFANRILWPLVRRTQILPDGGTLHTVDVQPLVHRLREVFSKAKEVEQMQRDEEATAIWRAVYAPLSEGKPGLVGALLARGEAQVLRLSMLYALLDGSSTITRVHLNAALAVWQYCEASALYIFGKASGDVNADTLLMALEAAYPEGLARKTILEETFQRNVRADELDRVINLLLTHHRITVQEVLPAKGPGRAKQILTCLPNELNELNEFNQPTYLSLSNDAVKSMGISSYPLRANYELIRERRKEGVPSREEFDV